MNAQDIPLIDEFLNYLRCERHFSPHTGKCYAADLLQFGEFLCRGAGPAPQSGYGVTTAPPAYAIRSPVVAATAVAVAPSSNGVAVMGKQLGEKFLAVNANIVRDFLGFLREQEYSKATTARKLATLRSFYKFL